MSVINQMLRELDARGGAPAELPATPSRPPGAGRRPAWRVLGGTGLLATAAAGYWMLHTAPVADPRADVPAAARQAEQVVNQPPAAAAPAQPPAPERTVADAGPAAAALRPPPARQPSRGPAPEVTANELNAPPAPLSVALADEAAMPPAEPAVVRKIPAPSPEAEAQQLYDEAQLLHRAGKVDLALGRYRQALERNPGLAGARLQFARALQEKGQLDVALSLLKAGFERHADDRLAIAAGRLLVDLGQPEEALAWLQRGQAGLRPADHALMGALLSQTQRHEEAGRAYQRALAADPGQGGWLLGLGLALEAQGRLDEARAAYRNALERGNFKPEVTQFLRERGA